MPSCLLPSPRAGSASMARMSWLFSIDPVSRCRGKTAVPEPSRARSPRAGSFRRPGDVTATAVSIVAATAPPERPVGVKVSAIRWRVGVDRTTTRSSRPSNASAGRICRRVTVACSGARRDAVAPSDVCVALQMCRHSSGLVHRRVCVFLNILPRRCRRTAQMSADTPRFGLGPRAST